jgi:eukaryotic-like serine/threonine-protein kinase
MSDESDLPEDDLLSIPTEAFASSSSGEKLGSMVGPYKLLGVLGEGGFGTVYLAEQEKPMRRRVALKVIKAGMDTRRVLARFDAERQALAMMDHPNIAKVFDAGSTESGRSYFVMELVHGEPITEYCDRHKLTLEERLDLFIPVCQAVQHAHQKGIIHRDIKPKNVLVAVVDDRPVPKVIDFGVAKAMAQPLSEQTIFTEQGVLIGTPEYMSPEQAEMSNLDIDTRSDIYSLGVLLYELLTGALPFDRHSLRQAGIDEIRRIIREVEPPKPSTRISSLGDDSGKNAERRQSDPHSLCRRLRQELDWIVMKTLEKDRTRRYATATALAEDVQRYLQHEPVQAGPPGNWYRIRKYSRRYRMPLAITASFAAFLVAITLLAIRGYYREADLRASEGVAHKQAVDERSRAEAERENAKNAKSAEVKQRRIAETTIIDMYTTLGLIAAKREQEQEAVLWFANAVFLSRDDPARETANRIRFFSWTQRCPLPLHAFPFMGRRIRKLDLDSDLHFLLVQDSQPVHTLWNLKRECQIPFPGGQDHVTAAALSPTGDQLAVATGKGKVEVFRLPAFDRMQEIPCRYSVQAVVYSFDGRYLAIAAGNIARVWDTQVRQFVTSELVHPAAVLQVALTAKRGLLATTCADGQVRVFSLDNSVSKATRFSIPLPLAAIDPVLPQFVHDDRFLVTLRSKTELAWLDTSTGKEVRCLRPDISTIFGVLSSPDGKYLVVYGFHEAQLYQATNGELLGRLKYTGSVDCVAFNPDSSQLLTGSDEDRTVCLWSIPSCQKLAKLPNSGIERVAFSRNGRQFVTAQKDGLIRVWEPPSDHNDHYFPIVGDARTISLNEGRYAIPSGWSFSRSRHTIQVYNLTTNKLEGSALDSGGVLNWVDFSPDGRNIVATGALPKDRSQRHRSNMDLSQQRGRVRCWEWRTCKEIFSPIETRSAPVDATYTPDGLMLVIACAGGEILLVDSQTGTKVRTLQNHGRFWHGRSPIRFLQFSPSGHRLVIVGLDSNAYLWNTRKWDLRAVMDHGSEQYEATFSRDGRWLATVGQNGRLCIWDADTGQAAAPPINHPDWVFSASFSPDAQYLVTGCRDHLARVWDWRNRRLACPALEHEAAVICSTFVCDGRWIVTSGFDNTVRFWEWRTGKAVMPCRELPDTGLSLQAIEKGKIAVVGRMPYLIVLDIDDLNKFQDNNLDLQNIQTLGEIIAQRRVLEGGTTILTTEEWLRRWRALRATIRQSASLLPRQHDPSRERPTIDDKVLAESHPDAPAHQRKLALVKEHDSLDEMYHGKKVAQKSARASWSPDGRRLVVGRVPNSQGLRIIDLQTEETQDLRNSGHDPAWSPGEGKWIAFARDDVEGDGKEEIWIVESTGKNPRKIAEGGFPSWSSDGKTLFFHSRRQQKVFVTQPDEKESRISEVCEMPWSKFPVILPKATQISYTDANTIHVLDRETKKEISSVPLPVSGFFFHSWSPDGKQLGVGNCYDNSGYNNGFWILNMETKECRKIASGPYTMPVWSPDGSKIALDYRGEGVCEVWVIETKNLKKAK